MLTRIFYATDLHGSDQVFLKFLGAAKNYNAQVLVMGGDMTGKAILPMVKLPDGSGYRCKFIGREIVAKTREEIAKLESDIRYNGFYPCYITEEEASELEKSSKAVDELFARVMRESVARWVQMAEERLKNTTDLKVFMMPGNDDPIWLDEVLNSSTRIVNPEGKVVWVSDKHEMISCGYSNRTPWNSPRELDEGDLEKMIDSSASSLSDPKNAIFNFHCPPYGSGLDDAPKLKDLKPVIMPGTGIIMEPVGSTAVRKIIERYQPLAALHGHIHESRGEARIGKTVCYNPGSEYGEGILRGLLLNIDEKSIKSRLFVSG